tara:strand:- start:1552 stop:1809 length:258 start_codon:yes stop_codon:yes gene_type:complete
MENNPVWEFSNTGTIIKLRYPTDKNGILRITIDMEEDAVFIEKENNGGGGPEEFGNYSEDIWTPISLMKHIVLHYDEAKSTGKVE